MAHVIHSRSPIGKHIDWNWCKVGTARLRSGPEGRIKEQGGPMLNMRILSRGAIAGVLALLAALTVSSSAADILDDWANVKAPPPPELKAVTLEGSTTALLIMDLGKTACSKPRCQATIPNV